MRKLAGGIPRAFKSHRTPEGAAYGAYCRAKLKRLGSLPEDALPTLREAGVVVIELGRLHRDAQSPRRTRLEHRRRRRETRTLRRDLVNLERRLEEIAKSNGKGFDPVTEFAKQRREP